MNNMMIISYQRFKGSALITSIFFIILIILLLFNSRDNLISQQKNIENNYANYLKLRLDLSKKLDYVDCPFENSDFSESIQRLKYNYHCIKYSLFLKDKISSQTYVKIESINSYFDISKVNIIIDDLNELPESSINNPQVVILNKPFSGKLNKDFYGIIITEHPIELSLGRYINGTIYSTLNKRSHKLRYVKKPKKEMIDRIASNYTKYFYLPNSKNLINDEK